MTVRKRTKSAARNPQGALGTMLFLIGLLIILMLSSLAADIAHFVAASTEMQSVVDAAAMSGAYDLQWNSTAANMDQAVIDAKYMAQHAAADTYNPSNNMLPANAINVSFSSLNGGTNNAVTVSISPPIAFIFGSIIGSPGALVGVAATAEKLPVLEAPAPPWFLETTAQTGPKSPPPLPSPSPAAPTTFPTSAYVTFADSSQPAARLAPPILPTYWVDMGLSNLSTAQTNSVGVAQVIHCIGRCVVNTNCNTTNPVVINGSIINANHGSYNSNVSNPEGNSGWWSNNNVVILPVTTNGRVIGLYAVKLTGPYVPKSFKNGQGVFGEFGVQFVGSADTLPGVTAMDPAPGNVYTNVGATVAILIK